MNTKNGYWTLVNVNTLDEKLFENFDDAYRELCTYGVPVLVDKENNLYRIDKIYYMIDFSEFSWVKTLTIS